jgi:hypothetical protein
MAAFGGHFFAELMSIDIHKSTPPLLSALTWLRYRPRRL